MADIVEVEQTKIIEPEAKVIKMPIKKIVREKE